MANVWPCIVLVYYLSGLAINDNCVQLWCQTSEVPLRLGKKRPKTLDRHVRFCGILCFLSTWGVIFFIFYFIFLA